MARFYENLRASRGNTYKAANSLPTRGDMQKERQAVVKKTPTVAQGDNVASERKATGVGTWDKEKISNVLDERWAGLHSSENPMISLNVDIPKTPSVIKIQTGRYKLDNNTNNTGINDDNALYIVGNTYQDNDDGTHFGMGWDGRPYSYTIKDDVVGDFTPLGVDEQKKAINRISNGKIEVHETITNPATLAEIYRSIKRMNENGNGNLVPDHVVIGDSEPGSVTLFGGDGVMGVTRMNKGTKENPEHIDLLGTDFPDIQAQRSNRSAASGFHSAGGSDAVPQHELAHAAEFAILDSPQRYYDKISKEAAQYKDKYSSSDLWDDAIGKIKYAIPLLMDSVFGTKFVPSKEEVKKMIRSENQNISGVAEFWWDYYLSPKDKYHTVEETMLNKADRKYHNWSNKYANGGWDAQDNLFEEAAKNTGYDSIEDAISSISGYAKSGMGSGNYNEAFAEAYTDVLLNGKTAKPFSKEVIRLYSKLADDTEKEFGRNKKPIQLDALNQLIDILPKDALNNPKKQFNKFQQNYRLLSR